MRSRYFIWLAFLFIGGSSMAQITGNFTVGGDFDKFYPVTFQDGGWYLHSISELQIVRSDIHENSGARGSLISKFRYHTTKWGHGANFIEADIHQVLNTFGEDRPFIAGWKDATISNGGLDIIVWLRGGGTTYHYNSVYANTVTVFDGVANTLPFQEVNGPAHSYKTAVDSYVNSSGFNATTAYFSSDRNNFFNGNVGIGTTDPKGYKLAVAGNMIAESVKVQLQSGWPDYVFSRDYQLPSLQQTEKHIKDKGHLPGIPSAAEVKANGIDVGEMNAKLLQKIEELTLHLIEQGKGYKALQKEVKLLKMELHNSKVKK